MEPLFFLRCLLFLYCTFLNRVSCALCTMCKRTFYPFFFPTPRLLWLLFLSCTSCGVRSVETWEDVKTASRYMRKNVQHFLGFENEESRQLATEEDFLGPQEGREIPSQEEDLCLEGTLMEENFLFAQTNTLFREAPTSLEVSFAYRQEAEHCLQPIYFAEDSHAIGKDESKALDQIAQLLETKPGFSLLIEGHSESGSSAAYNRA